MANSVLGAQPLQIRQYGLTIYVHFGSVDAVRKQQLHLGPLQCCVATPSAVVTEVMHAQPQIPHVGRNLLGVCAPIGDDMFKLPVQHVSENSLIFSVALGNIAVVV